MFLLQEKVIADDHDMNQITSTWSSLIGEKKSSLANRMIPFSFCSKVIHTLVDAFQIPPKLNGKLTLCITKTRLFKYIENITPKYRFFSR